MSTEVGSDGLVRALLPAANLTVCLAVVTGAAREAQRLHGLAPVSASLLGQALAGAGLLASLQKGGSRINLQLEVDGPLRGLFVDAGADGTLRGYVKNVHLDVELGQGGFRWRPALGNAGFLAVLRDVGGEFYRSSVELKHLDLAADLVEYFKTSDQVLTRVALAVQRTAAEPLGAVAGVLVQALPDGDHDALERLGATLSADLERALARGAAATPAALLEALFPTGCEVLAKTPLAWRCTCSKQRVLDTLSSLGRAEVESILSSVGSAAVSCQFCSTRHEVSKGELEALVASLAAVERPPAKA